MRRKGLKGVVKETRLRCENEGRGMKERKDRKEKIGKEGKIHDKERN